jgi:hypothetical protein
VGVQDDAIGLRIPAREPGLARKGLLRRGIRLALGELLTRDAAHQPGVTREVVVQALEEISRGSLRLPAVRECPAVYT